MTQNTNAPQKKHDLKPLLDDAPLAVKPNIVDMLKSGVHFGHKNSRWNPKMKPFIFGTKNNVHIIDLEKSIGNFKEVLAFMRHIVANGGKILFAGTKPQARQAVEETAIKLEMPFVTNRWLGGTFSNYREIKERIKYFNQQDGQMHRGDFAKYTKYEQSQKKKEIAKMKEKFEGIRRMDSLPQAVFVVDMKDGETIIREAKIAGIKTIAIADTNADPDFVDYAIPGNDDTVSSIKYIFKLIEENLAPLCNGLKGKKEDERNPQSEKKQ